MVIIKEKTFKMKLDIIEHNNKLLGDACIEGDFQTVLKITSECDNLDFSYPLTAATLEGHLDIVDYFINFPNLKIRKKITKFDNIIDAINISAKYGQSTCLIYFKEKFPNIYNEFVEKANYNEIINFLAMTGKLNTIKFLIEESPNITNLSFTSFIGETIQYNKKNCFNYFLSFLKNTEIPLFIQSKLIHISLYTCNYEYLDKLIELNLINLNEALTLNSFAILIDRNFDSLVYIVQQHNYKPNDLLNQKIVEYINKKEDHYLTKVVIDFVNILEKNDLKQKLDLLDIKSNNKLKITKI